MTRPTGRFRPWLATIAGIVVLIASTHAQTKPADDLADLVRQLGDADPHEREAAGLALAGLSPDRIDALRKATYAARPLSPAQSAGLRQAVVYVLTRNSLAEVPTGKDGYLGIAPLGRDDRAIVQGLDPDGAYVGEALFGLVASRYLDAGDRIVAFTLNGQRHDVDRWDELVKYLRPLRAGADLTVHVLRGRQSLSFALRLDAKPIETVNAPAAIDWLRRTADEAAEWADAEFDRRFAGVITD